MEKLYLRARDTFYENLYDFIKICIIIYKRFFNFMVLYLSLNNKIHQISNNSIKFDKTL